MTHKLTLLPTQRIHHTQNFRQIVPYLITRIGRAMITATVTAEIQRDHMTARESRSQRGKTGGVVQPAVQCQDWPLALFTPGQAPQPQTINLPTQRQWLSRTHREGSQSGGDARNSKRAAPCAGMSISRVAKAPGLSAGTRPASSSQRLMRRDTRG